MFGCVTKIKRIIARLIKVEIPKSLYYLKGVNSEDKKKVFKSASILWVNAIYR